MTRSNAREVAVHLIYEIDYTGEDRCPRRIETRMRPQLLSAAFLTENDVYAERPSAKSRWTISRTCVTGVCEAAQRSWTP